MPNSRQTPSSSSSASRVQSEYSVCSAAMGCAAWARRSVAGAASEMPRWRTLPLPDQPSQRAHRVLDRHRRIDPVDVVEIDRVHAEALQAGLAALRDVFRPAVRAGAAVGEPDVAELGGQDDLVAPAFDGAADQALVRAVAAVGVGGIDEIDAELDRAMDGGDGLGLAGIAVDRRHAHAAETHGAHVEPTQAAALHGHSPNSISLRPSLSTFPAAP